MPSPFPGMDPFLEDEKLWPELQQHLVQALYQTLLSNLSDRYRVRVNQRHYVTEQVLFTSVLREEHHEEFVELRQRTDGRLITLIDIVSPINKTTQAGRRAYLDQRQDGRGANASLVEIDLVLQGQPTLDYSRESLPDGDYTVTVTRPATPDRYEIYNTTLQKKLPRFRLPLASDDRDLVLDLQTAFSRAYDQAGFGNRINYKAEPTTSLLDEDRKWLDGILRTARLR